MIFESHAHYDDEAFDPDREELLASLPGLGIGRVVNVGASPAHASALAPVSRWVPESPCAFMLSAAMRLPTVLASVVPSASSMRATASS